jgi:hypothetical protein
MTEVVRLLVENWPEGDKALNTDGQTPLMMFGQEEKHKLYQLRRFFALLGGMYWCQ